MILTRRAIGGSILAAAFFLTPAFAQDAAAPAPVPAPEPAPATPLDALDACVANAARALETSREAADIVAEAAVAKCGREVTLATPRTGVMGSAAQARQMVKDSARETALLQIVTLRAARNDTPPPSPTKPASKKRRKKSP